MFPIPSPFESSSLSFAVSWPTRLGLTRDGFHLRIKWNFVHTSASFSLFLSPPSANFLPCRSQLLIAPHQVLRFRTPFVHVHPWIHSFILRLVVCPSSDIFYLPRLCIGFQPAWIFASFARRSVSRHRLHVVVHTSMLSIPSSSSLSS